MWVRREQEEGGEFHFEVEDMGVREMAQPAAAIEKR